MVPFFGKNLQTTCLRGCNVCLQEDKGESRFSVSLKYWKMSTKMNNDSVTTCFCVTLIRIKIDLFSEKLSTKLGTKLEVVCLN